jgi:hypothetical protein
MHVVPQIRISTKIPPTTWKNLPGHTHGKFFINRPYKKRSEDLLKLRRYQQRMAAAFLTGHAPVRKHLNTTGLLMGIQHADFAG